MFFKNFTFFCFPVIYQHYFYTISVSNKKIHVFKIKRQHHDLEIEEMRMSTIVSEVGKTT